MFLQWTDVFSLKYIKVACLSPLWPLKERERILALYMSAHMQTHEQTHTHHSINSLMDPANPSSCRIMKAYRETLWLDSCLCVPPHKKLLTDVSNSVLGEWLRGWALKPGDKS